MWYVPLWRCFPFVDTTPRASGSQPATPPLAFQHSPGHSPEEATRNTLFTETWTGRGLGFFIALEGTRRHWHASLLERRQISLMDFRCG